MTNRDEKIEEFWLPFCVTFIITVLSAAAMCLVRYNISSDSESVIEFHNVQCVNYIWLAVYMIAEALVPTMITFAISDSLAYRRREKENGKFFMKLTFCIAFLICLGFVYPLSKNSMVANVIMILIFLFAFFTFFVLVPSSRDGSVCNRKNEMSDGKMF